MCDYEKFQVVLANLLTNAVQALEKGGIIKISFDAGKDWTVIKFEDNGPGIDSKMLEKIFDPLITTKQKGTGLYKTTL